MKVPILGRQLELSVERAKRAIVPVLELPVGGTAVGSGINTHPEFGGRVSAVLAEESCRYPSHTSLSTGR